MCRVKVCGAVALLFLPFLLLACSVHKRASLRQSESRQQHSSAVLRDTLARQLSAREHEETTWQVEMVREWVDVVDTLSREAAPRPGGVERWHIRAVSTRDLHRADTLHGIESISVSSTDSVARLVEAEEEQVQKRGGTMSWRLSLLLLALSAVSVGFIVKR